MHKISSRVVRESSALARNTCRTSGPSLRQVFCRRPALNRPPAWPARLRGNRVYISRLTCAADHAEVGDSEKKQCDRLSVVRRPIER